LRALAFRRRPERYSTCVVLVTSASSMPSPRAGRTSCSMVAARHAPNSPLALRASG